MPTLLNKSPIPAAPSWIVYRNERILLRENQVILWVSLTPQWLDESSPSPFPVILDTGFNHSFAIHEQHLLRWAGLRADLLARRGTLRDRGQKITLRAANLWVHPNESGSRERLANREPERLETDFGIAIYPGSEFPRLPILGLRAIVENNLKLSIDGRRKAATLRTASRWWPL